VLRRGGKRPLILKYCPQLRRGGMGSIPMSKDIGRIKNIKRAGWALLIITLLAAACFLGMEEMLRSGGYLPRQLTAGALEGQNQGRFVERIAYVEGPLASLESGDGEMIWYYIFLPGDNPEGKLALAGIRGSRSGPDFQEVLAQSSAESVGTAGPAAVEIAGSVYPLPESLRAHARQWLEELAGESMSDAEMELLLFPYCLEEEELVQTALDPYLVFFLLFGLLYLGVAVYVISILRKSKRCCVPERIQGQTGTFSQEGPSNG